MEEMYQEINKNLCSTGIACEHPEAQWRERNGEVVETEEKAFGCKTKYELIHLDHFIFIDKKWVIIHLKQTMVDYTLDCLLSSSILHLHEWLR
jgi:hypothetical protein